MEKMKPFDFAENIVRSEAEMMSAEKIDMNTALGRVLAEDIASDINMPPFNKSAMDGYACRKADLLKTLHIADYIPAGKFSEIEIKEGECARILTGAMVPKECDIVFIDEQTEKIDSDHVRFTGEKSSTNICYRAEDIRQGQIVLKKGQLIRPQDIAVLASLGATQPLVYKMPQIAIMSTGDELVEAGQKPGPSQIRNSNGYQLLAQCRSMGIDAEYFGIVKDTPEETKETLRKATEKNQVILFTGGVSAGDYDFVPGILKEEGFDFFFESLAVQPGRPTIFGKKGNIVCFGLPGNPVSSFIQFELLVKPYLYKCMEHDFKRTHIRLPLGEDYKRKRSVRHAFIPIQINEKHEVVLTQYHGSAHIHALSFSDGLMEIQIGIGEKKKGELVDVRLF